MYRGRFVLTDAPSQALLPVLVPPVVEVHAGLDKLGDHVNNASRARVGAWSNPLCQRGARDRRVHRFAHFISPHRGQPGRLEALQMPGHRRWAIGL